VLSISAEIPIHLLGATEGTLGENDPACLVQTLPAPTGGAVWYIVVQLAFVQQLLQAGHELATKERAHDMDGK
jgi:hypothetical protein